MINKVLSTAQYFLCHPYCYLCQKLIQQRFPLCRSCLASLPELSSDRCKICAERITTTDRHCGECLTYPPQFHQVLAPVAFSSNSQTIIHQFKFQHKLYWSHVIAKLMLHCINNSLSHVPEMLSIVPTHHSKIRKRGFNPSAELAKPLARWLDRPLLLQQPRKIRNTVDQSSLTATARRRNLHQAFRLKGKVAQSILLIDDVLSTGATANEMAALLKRQGAKTVIVCCFARNQKS